MAVDLTGRVALVTGGARGIGLGVARALLEAGSRVAIAARTVGDLERARAALDGGSRVSSHRCDVSDPGEVAQLLRDVVARHDGLDALVCSHGVYPGARSFLDVSLEDFERTMAVNVRGTFLCAQGAARVMLDGERIGRIVVISSMNAVLSQEGAADYDASKAALHGLVRSMAIELAPRGVTVNAVAPGWIRTPMSEEEIDHLSGQVLNPSHRVGEPADIARACVWLADPENSYVTGTVTVVDGGQTAMLAPPWSPQAAGDPAP